MHLRLGCTLEARKQACIEGASHQKPMSAEYTVRNNMDCSVCCEIGDWEWVVVDFETGLCGADRLVCALAPVCLMPIMEGDRQCIGRAEVASLAGFDDVFHNQ